MAKNVNFQPRGPTGPTEPESSDQIHYVFPVTDSTSGSAVVYQSPFNKSIHNSLDSFTGPKLNELPEDLQEKIHELNFNFINWEIEEHKKQWKNQRIIFWIIFGIVMSLTLIGISLSVYQLIISANMDRLDTLITEFGFDKANLINIKSTVVGTTILVISIVFFYLFLQFMYKTKTSSEAIHQELVNAYRNTQKNN